jgi:hypothetical protein
MKYTMCMETCIPQFRGRRKENKASITQCGTKKYGSYKREEAPVCHNYVYIYIMMNFMWLHV